MLTHYLANEWTITRMNSRVGQQMMLQREALFTLGALERPKVVNVNANKLCFALC